MAKTDAQLDAAAEDHIQRAEELIAEAEDEIDPVMKGALAALASAHVALSATGLHVDAYIKGKKEPKPAVLPKGEPSPNA